MSLACHYRVAGAKSSVGFPEVCRELDVTKDEKGRDDFKSGLLFVQLNNYWK